MNIYIHIPFCESKCVYCNFVSRYGKQEEIDAYFSALKTEIESKKDKALKVNTIYLGGGTPSCVQVNHIGEVLQTVHDCFDVAENVEISMESNPNSLTEEKLKKYLKFGINRLSIGVQSLDNAQLKKIGRLHSSQQAIEAIRLAKKVGFKNINADLLLGLEDQPIKTSSQWKDANESAERLRSWGGFFDELVRLGVTHISAYMLIIEKGTPLHTMVQKGEYKPANDDESVQQYDDAVRELKKLGFERYEVSNFAKPGFECKHNVNIWQGEDYLGFGLSAHGCVNGVRYENPGAFEEYYLSLQGRKKCGNLIHSHKLTREEKREEFIMLSLRLATGLNLERYKEKFEEDLLETKEKEMSFLIKNKLVKISNKHIQVLEFGVLNSIILKLI